MPPAPTIRANHHTYVLAAIALAMWYAGAAQQNGGAYLLAFLTGSITLVSWLHAKANLRGLKLEVGSITTATQGGSVVLPLVLSAGEGALPCGLEITAEGAHEPLSVDTLIADHPINVRLRVPAGAAGRHTATKVIVRSRYPLGFFTAQRVFQLPRPHLVHPKPAGELPLPPVTENNGNSTAAHASKQHGKTGAGDDFAGVREWQPGDSLRQVDWKAVARERPMMVKLWTGETKGIVWLDWAGCPLPEAERPGQIAEWIQKAELLGIMYGLRLPNKCLQPGIGVAHRRRCLDELALLQPTEADQSEAASGKVPVKIPSTENWTSIPGRPTYLLGLAMMLAGLPMIGNVPVIGLIVYYFSILLHWYRLRHQYGPVGLVWRLLIVAAGVAGIWLEGHTLFGLEPGVSILLVVAGGKILESRNAHDLQVIATLGWFLCLCALALDQALGRSLFVLFIFVLVAMSLVRLRQGRPGLKSPARKTFVLLAQALPLVALLFPLFPRLPPGMVLNLSRRLGHHTGISSNLDPGSVAEIAQSPGRAFWATFPEGPVPEIGERYWRCLVLWRCDGLKWQRGAPPSVSVVKNKSKDAEPQPPRPVEYHQRITLDPTGNTWLPALDVPTHVMSNMAEHRLNAADGVLSSVTTVTSVRRYDVGSQLLATESPLPKFVRAIATQIPADLSPEVKKLVATLKANRTVDFQIANAALDYFRKNDFRYTLQPDKYEDHALDEFLFRRRLGFCEHFAASFATLMRACGIPSRVVIGYLGGEHSERWDHYIVRQADAHAWCELWYEGKGWTRVDPTAALAPGRLTSDLQTFLEGGVDSAFAMNRNTWWGRAITDGQLFWDNINYQWYTHIVQYDDDAQDSLYNDLVRLGYSVLSIIVVAGLVFLTPLILTWWWLKRTPRSSDPSVRLWLSFCAKLGKAGLARKANEAPTTFTSRAAMAFPKAAKQIENIGNLYVQLRYGGDDSVASDFKRCVRGLRIQR